jgi:hypothetical protein
MRLMGKARISRPHYVRDVEISMVEGLRTRNEEHRLVAPPVECDRVHGRARLHFSAMSDVPFYSPNRQAEAPRQPTPGLEVWRLRHADRTQSCELRDSSKAGAGWDVLARENDELLFSRRRANEQGARYVAESFKQDLVRTG